MNSERIDNPNLSGNAVVLAPEGEDEKALLKSLTEQAKNSSLSTAADAQMLAGLLTARLARALGQALDSSRLATYGERLADLELSTLLAVFEHAEKECRFFLQIANYGRWPAR